jgi:hypothetical protein
LEFTQKIIFEAKFDQFNSKFKNSVVHHQIDLTSSNQQSWFNERLLTLFCHEISVSLNDIVKAEQFGEWLFTNMDPKYQFSSNMDGQGLVLAFTSQASFKPIPSTEPNTPLGLLCIHGRISDKSSSNYIPSGQYSGFDWSKLKLFTSLDCRAFAQNKADSVIKAAERGSQPFGHGSRISGRIFLF